MYCQANEEKVIQDYFQSYPPKYQTFVDIGAGDGYSLSNTAKLKDMGWKGLQLDANNKGNQDVIEAFITVNNVNKLLDEYCVEQDFDFLTLDLDGNDFWIVKQLLTRYQPNLICVEYNPRSDKAIAIEYNSDHVWDETDYYGATPNAWLKLMTQYDYKFYAQTGCNLFFGKQNEAKEFRYDVIGWHKLDPLNRIWVEV